MPIETWNAIPSEPGYAASDWGRIKNLETGKIVGQCSVGENRDYLAVRVGNGRQRKVHHLILEAFIGPRPPNTHGCHNNGDSRDNVPTNLRWDTPVANALDCWKHGTRIAKLAEDDVREIRRIVALKQFTYYEIGKRFGVSHTTVRHITIGRTWKHLLPSAHNV